MSAAQVSRLGNGLVAVARPNRAAPSIAIHLVFEAGAAFDPPGKAGAAALVAELLDRGAGRLSAGEIASFFDDLGVAYAAAARRDSIEIEIRLLSKHLEEVLEHLRLIVAEPTFPEAEVVRQRGQILTTIAERDQDTGGVGEMTLWSALYPADHPYHRPRLGTRDSVPRIERTDLVAFHRRYVRPEGAVLGMAGDFEPNRALDLVGRIFGSWDGGSTGTRAVIPEAPIPAGEVSAIKPIEGKSQADILLGFRGLERRSPDFATCLVLNNVLGEFSLGGRLGKAIRDRAGLAYYAFSHFSAGLGKGPFMARAGVAPNGIRKAVVLMRKTIQQVVKHGVTAAEINDSRQALAAAIPRRMETNPEAAAIMAESEFYGLGIDFPERLPRLIREVSRKDVGEAARKYLTPGHCVLVVAGPVTAKEALA